MSAATFFIGIVLAIGLGAALAALWLKARATPPADVVPPVPLFNDGLARIEAQLRDYETQLRGYEAQRQHALGGLENQLSSLSRETVALSQALRAPNSRGRWGELTLRRVAELAGMAPYCDFFEQEAGNGMRPDMIVRLPGKRTLAVDAKVPLSA